MFFPLPAPAAALRSTPFHRAAVPPKPRRRRADRHRPCKLHWALLPALVLPAATGLASTTDFPNWESPHVHPLELTSDGARLLAVNTVDARLEVFDATSSPPDHIGAVFVGLDPVSVRARSTAEVWVVNHVSDSISIVDLPTRTVIRTLQTDDEPADVVFTSSPPRAFVTCSQADTLLVFDLDDLDAAPERIPLLGGDPRALAVSPEGDRIYVAFFESGNGTTVIPGGESDAFEDAVSDPEGPYGGQNPPPNSGTEFVPPLRPEFTSEGDAPPPPVSLILRRAGDDSWQDDNGADWSSWVDGEKAEMSNRYDGWELLDHDVAIVDADLLTVEYVGGLVNLAMDLDVRPTDGELTVVGTEALNEVRFEPNLKGRFVRVLLGGHRPSDDVQRTVDLNAGHLDYGDAQVAQQSNPATADQTLRDLSVGDPRAIRWRSDGERAFVAGMGSNNVVVVDAAGLRQPPYGSPGPIEVGEGPTGLALDEVNDRLYVLNRFDASVSVIDVVTLSEAARVSFFDPTPEVIRVGRRFLYDTRATSGLGHLSCASCHVDARNDRLAWDLGDPQGEVKPLDPEKHNLGMGFPGLTDLFEDFHPMKGPMVTQTLQGIVGMEPLHWRGDRDGIEEFNGAFRSLLGDDIELTTEEMQQFEDYLATLRFPPNPFREVDNSLPTDLPLPGHVSIGAFTPAGTALPNGNAQRGLDLFLPPNNAGTPFSCVTCHTLPTGAGADVEVTGAGTFEEIPAGPSGERHLALVANLPLNISTVKTPQLLTQYEKVGMNTTPGGPASIAGFGFSHDGAIDSLARFLSPELFFLDDAQQLADLVALMLAFSGSGYPEGSDLVVDAMPPGPQLLDTHAAVGRQITFHSNNYEAPEGLAQLDLWTQLADDGAVDLIAKRAERGWLYLGAGVLKPDDPAQANVSLEDLLPSAALAPLTFTVVPAGSGTRFGIDRDQDGRPDGTCLTCPIFTDGFEAGDLLSWSVTTVGD